MRTRSLIKLALVGVVALAGLALPACQATERPQSLTGQVSERGKARYVPHSKGQQWGRIVYDR